MNEKTDSAGGLTEAEVARSRAEHGTNVLTPPKREPLWRKFLSRFGDPLIVILLVAGALSAGIALYERLALGEGWAVFFEPGGIFAAVLLATGLSFLFETRAERAFDILNQVNDDEPVDVVRAGGPCRVPRRDVVVGDVVTLATGCEVPADGDLLEDVALSVDESSLTGEPTCRKTTDPRAFDAEATFPSNRVLRGTKVMEGHGTMRVTAVGDGTENGRVFAAARIDDSVKTPLDEQLAGLARAISRVSYALATLVVVGRLAVFFGTDPLAVWRATEPAHLFAYLLQSLMLAVTLVVVSVPEGLPMAVTLSLAYSMRRMFRAKLLVRRLHACETMGAATVICTDKTGTLTQNRMRVQETHFDGLGPDARLSAEPGTLGAIVCEGMAANATATLDLTDPSAPEPLGNPTEGAILLWLHRQGLDCRTLRAQAPHEAELPFCTERKYMASVVTSAARPGRRVLYVKGAPEIVLGFCGADAAADGAVRARLLDCQGRALRTLGFAWRELADGERPITDDGLAGLQGPLTFLGLVGIADPVRPDVPKAIADCLGAGIAVKVVTGDTPATAREIARQIGLWTDDDCGDALITGPEFAALDDTALDRRVGRLKIIARARPLDKKRLVEALRRAGEVVAVTGDGTNDAPALKAAHVGLSMGDGTSVAKEASDVTILDDSFASIVRAVVWGRSLYRNIQRFILFQTTVNVVACLTVLVGAFVGTKSPLSVTQMLWVNLIMDTFAAMAMASLPPSEAVLRERPRPRGAFIVSRAMCVDLALTGTLFTAILLGALAFLRGHEIRALLLPPAAAATGLSAYELTVFFTFFVLLQFWNVFRVRTFGGGAPLDFAGCRVFMGVALLILVGQAALVTFGGRLFDVVPLRPSDWAALFVASALVPAVVAFLRKAIR